MDEDPELNRVNPLSYFRPLGIATALHRLSTKERTLSEPPYWRSPPLHPPTLILGKVVIETWDYLALGILVVIKQMAKNFRPGAYPEFRLQYVHFETKDVRDIRNKSSFVKEKF